MKNSKAIFDLKRAAYLDEFEKFGSYGRKTTCVYQFLGQTEHEDCKVIIYFLLQGLGIAVRFDSHISHSFFGYLFTHCTALPVIVKNGRVYYYHEKISIEILMSIKETYVVTMNHRLYVLFVENTIRCV